MARHQEAILAAAGAGQQRLQHVAGDRFGRLRHPRPRIGPPRLLPGLLHQGGGERRDQIAHPVKRLPGSDPAVQRRRGRAAERHSQPDRLQFHRHILRAMRRDAEARPVGQVLRMVENEPQRHLLLFGPVQGLAESRHLPGRDISQIALPGPERIGRRAAPIQLGEGRFVGLGQLGVGGQGEGGHGVLLKK